MNLDNKVTNSELPKGWAIETIGKLFDAWGGATPSTSEPRYWNGDIPWISSKDVKQAQINQGSDFITEDALAETRLRLCPTGSVLLVVRSGILANKLPVAITTGPVAINQDLKALDCGKSFLNEWLALALRAQAHEILLANRKDGTTVQSIKFDELKLRDLHVPPQAEQERIVAQMEKLLARVNAARERLDSLPGILKRFRQSILSTACSGQLTADWRQDDGMDGDLPRGWKRVELEELLPKGGIFDGPFGSNLKTADYTDSGVRVIRMENIGHLHFNIEKETYISDEKYRTLAKHTVGEGDIIFASFISDEIRACVLPSLPLAIAKADCFCIRPIDSIDRKYLSYQLVSSDTYNELVGAIHGATRPRVNTTQLRSLPIRICPLTEQKEIVRRVQALFKLADSIERRLEAGRTRANGLTQSILRSAFRGELVPTEAELARAEGRDYEPASTLLARIQVERNVVPSSQEKTKLKVTQVSLDLLLLLEAWGKPVSIIPLEDALSLMQQPDAIKSLDKVILLSKAA